MTGWRTETLRRAVFGLLVVATFAAFFVTQRLKHSPTLVQAATAVPYIYQAKGHRKALISFKIKRADDVTVTVVGANGDDIDTLASEVHMQAYLQRSFRWRGLTASGRRAPFGLYRIRVRLRDAGRSVLLARPDGELATIRVEPVPASARR
ncbi:MAG TPA: hypothetical protein VIJ51_19485 [Solirubrobacteraceae bacterium]